MRPTAMTRPDAPAEPTAATCACTVSLHELSAAAGRSGIIDDVVMRYVFELGIKVAPDWRGDPAVFAPDARRLLDAIVTFQADHDAKWREYERYVAAEREKATEARLAAARKARAEEEAEQRQWSEAQRAEWEKKRAEELAEQDRMRRERQGDPVPFNEFKAGKAS